MAAAAASLATGAVFLYPLATLFCIIVTANHFWIDGVGGLLAFAVGTLIGWGMHRWNQNRLDRKHAALLEPAASPARRDDDGRRRRARRAWAAGPPPARRPATSTSTAPPPGGCRRG